MIRFRYGTAVALTVLLALASPVPAHAMRLVTIGGEVTETVFALGQGAQVVAVDSTSVWPPQAQALPRVGYVRTLAAEGILAQQPDLILAASHAGPPEVLDTLRRAGIEVLVLPGPPPARATDLMIRAVGERLGNAAGADQLIATIHADLARTTDAPPIRALAVIGGQGGQLMAAGSGTRAAAMLALAGAHNVATFPGYRPLSDEGLMALNPEALVLPDHAVPMLGGVDQLLQRPGVQHTAAGQHRHLVVMDGLLLLGMGPRLGQAVQQLHAALHPAP